MAGTEREEGPVQGSLRWDESVVQHGVAGQGLSALEVLQDDFVLPVHQGHRRSSRLHGESVRFESTWPFLYWLGAVANIVLWVGAISFGSDIVEWTKSIIYDASIETDPGPVQEAPPHFQKVSSICQTISFIILSFYRIISQEISKIVSKGTHPHLSIRDIIQNQNLENKAMDMLTGMRRFDP